MKVRGWLRERFATPSAVYGLIVFQTLIAVAANHDATVAEVLVVAVSSLIVFFIAKVFSELVAGHGRHHLRAALGQALEHSVGMLFAAIIPAAILLVCAIIGTPTETAELWALLSVIVILGFLGYESFTERGYAMWVRLVVGALGTACLGLIVLALNYLVH